MDKLIKPWRLAALIALIAVLTVIFLISLYRLQIVDGANYYAQSQNSNVTRNTVVAARGNILDRYGRALTSNRVCNNLSINAAELFEQEDPNAIILELTRAVEDSGGKYTDTLPITKEPPFEYVPNMTESQKIRLEAYLKENKLPVSTTAVELMAFFREKFEIDNNYTAEEMRTVAGVRYEIKIRYIINTSDYVFAEDVSIDLISKLMENGVPGFTVSPSYVREYKTKYAAHLLGYVGFMNPEEYKNYRNEGYPLNAIVGRSGVEKAFESYLHGVDGEARVTQTRAGTVIDTHYTKEPQPGNHSYLTIDLALQEVSENSLSAYIANTNEQRKKDNEIYEAMGEKKKIKDMIPAGAIAVVKVDTGEPLALVSAPSFDPATLLEDYDALREDENAPLVNRALSGTYAPGSTFKPVTALAALNEKKVSTGTGIYDAGVFDKYRYSEHDYAPTCWLYPKGSHGTVNVTEAIKVSCNYYFYTIGDMLEIDKLEAYARRFGLGEHTGIELPEEIGVMSNRKYKEEVTGGEPWHNGDMLQTAIGQYHSVFTPLQLANYTAALANNGNRYEASILKAVRSYDYSQSLYEREPKIAGTVALPQEYYDAVKQGLYEVANDMDGTAYKIFGNSPYKVAAKTGTAQLGENITNNGVFICYAPYDNPEIAVAVVVEKGGSGSEIATIARDILDYYFAFKNSAVSIEAENSLLK